MNKRFETCIKCGGDMIVVLAVNPVTHQCEKCGHEEYSLIDVMPPAPSPEERVPVDVFCISAGDSFSKIELLALKKINSDFKDIGNLELIRKTTGVSKIFIGTMPKYQSKGVAEEYSESNLRIITRESNA